MNKDSVIYIAGHTGLIGSACHRLLLEEGYQRIIVTTHDELELTDSEAVAGFFEKHQPEYVILAAGRVGGIVANTKHPADFLGENLAIQQNVITEAHRTGVRKLVFFGSSCMYPRECAQPMAESALLTGHPEPTSIAYATAKLAGVQMCLAINKQLGEQRFIPLIPNSVYGPNDNFDPSSGHVLSSLIRRFEEATRNGIDKVTLWGSGTPRREFVYSDDVAACCLQILEKDISGLPLPLNVGSGEDISIRDLAGEVAQMTGYKGEIEWDLSKPDGALRKLLDSGRARAIGWAPITEFNEGLKKTLKWYQLYGIKHLTRPQITLYTGNHDCGMGIEDIVDIVKGVFENRGIIIEVSDKLNSETPNIIIENFENTLEIEKIKNFKNDYPQVKLIFLLTEFSTHFWRVKTFNCFGGLEQWFCTSLIDIYLRTKRKDFRQLGFLEFIKRILIILLCIPLVLIKLPSEFISKRFSILEMIKNYIHNTNRERLRMHKRYLAYEVVEGLSDGNILMHKNLFGEKTSKIERGKNLGVINPELDWAKIKAKLFNNKKLKIAISGSITKFRRSIINQINKNIYLYKIDSLFGYCDEISFSQKRRKRNAAFSIHPPQSKTWRYCSPTRLYRSLAVDGAMPIITKNFHQSPIEDLCIEGVDLMYLHNIFEKPEKILKELDSKIKEYNDKILTANNNIVAGTLINMEKNHIDLSSSNNK